jgi:hypothetical protein
METTGIQALLNTLYDVKFSKHTPLVVVLLSMIYTVFRSGDYLARAFGLPPLVTWPTAIFIELLVLATAAAVFIALRAAYIAELKQQDAGRAKLGFYIGFLVLGLAFLALLFVAGADAWQVTQQLVPTFIMVLIQGSQMLLIAGFIIAADLEERDRLRIEYANWQETQAEQAARSRAGKCPYCSLTISPSNRARHMRTCSARP